MADVQRPPTEPGISHVGLSVSDLERSLAFYCEVLGPGCCARPTKASGAGSGWP